MYARDLMVWLHRRLGDGSGLDQAVRRFESLRGYGRLPKGRENAGVRLTSEQIASAVLGFAHPAPGFAGHASLILGDLRPVGGEAGSFKGARSLREAIASLADDEDRSSELVRVNLTLEQDFRGEEYGATVYFRQNGQRRVASFVSKLAASLLVPGAEQDYDHEQLRKQTAIQRSLSPEFFRDLSREVSISRQLDRPLKTDWTEYETEEEKAEFYRRLGARRGSSFLNLRVDAQVTWPEEPTTVSFGGHQLVLFPKTGDHSHSVSIDLAHENLTADDARSLINRMLSVMSWCDDQPASLHEGWSGNPVPVPVRRKDLAFVTTHYWLFERTLPENEKLLMRLAYYRDGLNARSVGLASHAVLSFFRAFEKKRHSKKSEDKKMTIEWIGLAYSQVKYSIPDYILEKFDEDVANDGGDVGAYIYVKCRVATAHAAIDAPSDPDGAEESRRLLTASKVMQALARFFIKQEFQFSSSYFSDAAE